MAETVGDASGLLMLDFKGKESMPVYRVDTGLARLLVEDKADGPALIQALRHELYGLVAVTPEGGRVTRAQAVSPQVESCNVYLPHPSIAPCVEFLYR